MCLDQRDSWAHALEVREQKLRVRLFFRRWRTNRRYLSRIVFLLNSSSQQLYLFRFTKFLLVKYLEVLPWRSKGSRNVWAEVPGLSGQVEAQVWVDTNGCHSLASWGWVWTETILPSCACSSCSALVNEKWTDIGWCKPEGYTSYIRVFALGGIGFKWPSAFLSVLNFNFNRLAGFLSCALSSLPI